MPSFVSYSSCQSDFSADGYLIVYAPQGWFISTKTDSNSEGTNYIQFIVKDPHGAIYVIRHVTKTAQFKYTTEDNKYEFGFKLNFDTGLLDEDLDSVYYVAEVLIDQPSMTERTNCYGYCFTNMAFY
jgi:hypothetical protein